jgi:hypothetical protein
MSSTLWIPLVVAVVGVSGTLSAAVFTQVWAARRENERWVREQTAEEKRWQREQEERRQQWQREDRARWLEVRRTIYAEFLLGLQTWSTALSKAEGELRENGSIADETTSLLQNLEEKYGGVYQSLRIIAPKMIIEWAAGLMLDYGLKSFDLTIGKLPPSGKEGIEDDARTRSYEERLHDGIRKDLGLED